MPPHTDTSGTASQAHTVETRDLAQLVDAAPWSSYQKWLLGCFALVFAVDGLANQSLGIALPALIADWGGARASFAPVAASNLAGVALGSIMGGLIGDRIGRRWALISAIFLFGLMTAAGGLTHSVTQLILVRFIDGVGIGAAIPNGAALISEFTPASRRGRAIAIGMVFIPIGGILSGMLGAVVLKMLGWQAMFFIAGALPMLLALTFIRILPESPGFLLRAGRPEAVAEVLARCGIRLDNRQAYSTPPGHTSLAGPMKILLAPEFRRQTLLLWGGFFTCLMASYTIFNWVPTMLHTLGFDLTLTSLGITTFHIGGAVGALFSGVLVDRKGFSTAHMSLAAAASSVALVMAVVLHQNITIAVLILPMILTLGFCMAGLHNTLYTLAAETYPTAARATGVGTASATGRLGAVLSSYTGVMSLDLGGSAAFFGVIAILLALCGLAGWTARKQITVA